MWDTASTFCGLRTSSAAMFKLKPLLCSSLLFSIKGAETSIQHFLTQYSRLRTLQSRTFLLLQSHPRSSRPDTSDLLPSSSFSNLITSPAPPQTSHFTALHKLITHCRSTKQNMKRLSQPEPYPADVHSGDPPPSVRIPKLCYSG